MFLSALERLEEEVGDDGVEEVVAEVVEEVVDGDDRVDS